MIEDPKTRKELAKTARLWAMAVICAAAGAYAVQRSGSLGVGVAVFLLVTAVLGTLLWLYERRRRDEARRP